MLLEYGNAMVGSEWKIDERIPPGYSRVYLVGSGSVEYADELHCFSLQPGCLYIFPSASAYRMRQDPTNCLDCLFIHMDVFPALILDPVVLSMEAVPVIKHLFDTIAAAIDASDIRLLHALVGAFELYCNEHGLIQPPAQPISGVLQFIARHIQQDMTIGELSRIAGYNEQYFIRLFKKTVGLTPYQYIISYRLKEAKKMLRSDLSVTQVANLTGYGDIKTFSRAFKYNFGLSPSEFKHAPAMWP